MFTLQISALVEDISRARPAQGPRAIITGLWRVDHWVSKCRKCKSLTSRIPHLRPRPTAHSTCIFLSVIGSPLLRSSVSSTVALGDRKLTLHRVIYFSSSPARTSRIMPILLAISSCARVSLSLSLTIV